MLEPPLRIGVSACLIGQAVRYDGGHKRDDFVIDQLGQAAELIPVCPELEVGMGVPRETIRLERDGDRLRLVAPRSGTDWTEPMRRFSARRAAELAALELSGFVLKKDSPSCGMERVRVHVAGQAGAVGRSGRGLFAAALIDALPLLPVEEEGRLRDAGLRESFIERVFAHRRLRARFAGSFTVGDLVRFHSAEKMLLLAHDEKGYRALGRLVAAAKGRARDALGREYQASFMASLARPATRRKHVNVLQHMAGHLKKLVDDGDRAELGNAIADFAAGRAPLLVPLTLLAHHVRRCGVDYLAGQTYLAPHPAERMLRNHV